MTPPPADDAGPDARRRIMAAAVQLLASGGRDALTTRALAASAGVQAPTLYRLFGDKRGVLEAIAEQELAAYVAAKAAIAPDADALADFRAGWDRHVAFGLAHPALFSFVYGDPMPDRASPAAEAGRRALRAKIRGLAAAGLLRIGEAQAADLTHAACIGAVLTLLATRDRDPSLATAAREAVVAALTSIVPAAGRPGPAGAAIALRATLDETRTLSPGERHLMAELLDRIVADHSPDVAVTTPAQ